jgi:hypothetical protein
MLARRLFLVGAAGAALIAATSASLAQNYPTRNIRFVVPFAAGSATDALARIVGEHVSQRLGPSVVIEKLGGRERGPRRPDRRPCGAGRPHGPDHHDTTHGATRAC